eukprot:4630314-Heterocapsa_arctica.AAC.1
MRHADDGRSARHPPKQVAADEGDDRDERDELVGEPRGGSRRADGALHRRRAVQGLRTTAVELRPEQ